MTAFYCICVYRRASGKESACNAGATGDVGLIPGWGGFPGEGNGTPEFLPGKFHGHRSLRSIVHWVSKSWLWFRRKNYRNEETEGERERIG